MEIVGDVFRQRVKRNGQFLGCHFFSLKLNYLSLPFFTGDYEGRVSGLV